MASEKTVRRSLKIQDRLTQVFGPEIPPFPVIFDGEGNIVTKWEGGGSLVEARKRGPGMLERIYRELPRETLLRFIILTKAPTKEPTQEEWAEFETRLFTTARRVITRQIRKQFRKPLERLPGPRKVKRKRGRPRLKRERPILVRQTIEGWLDSGECKTKTEAVEKAARLFGDGTNSLHVDTIWRYLRRAGRKGPRSEKSSVQ